LRHEVALRETTDLGNYLVVPAQLTREHPEIDEVPGQSVKFKFKGSIQNIYATLVVRLARTQIFEKQSMWHNAVTYSAKDGGICGIFLRDSGPFYSEVVLFYDENATTITRQQFESYVDTHLQNRSEHGSVIRSQIVVCHGCNETIPEKQMQARMDRGYDFIRCPVCENEIQMNDGNPDTAASLEQTLVKMDQAADKQRDMEMASTVIRGKIESDDFDVFLCHNSKDKDSVKNIAGDLREFGIHPWLDEWSIKPGTTWQDELQKQIIGIRSVAVIIGSGKMGPWQNIELMAFIQQFVDRKCPVIPVILSNVRGKPKLPPFLRLLHCVDFRNEDPDPTSQLVWGVTGRKE